MTNSPSDTKKVDVHSVEIIGGATRIPMIQQIIQEVFKVEQVSRTLNASECVARGCAMMSAVLSPLFRVAEYHIEEANYYPIRVNWTFLGQGGKLGAEGAGNDAKKQTAILFDYGCSIPCVKSLTFTRIDPI